MEVVIKTEFSPGDRIWMPDGSGGREKGRITRIMIMRMVIKAEETQKAMNIVYECEDIEGNRDWYKEWQLKSRGKAE